jgi:5'-nucleotidase
MQIRSVLLIALLLASPLGTAAAQDQRPPVELRILAINDFHGNLEPPPGGIRISDPSDATKKITVSAGGSERMTTLVRQLRGEAKNSVFVAAGDLIGASPLLSSMFHDEPTIESMSLLGLEISSVGNHEFDKGKIELKRMQSGGCHPVDGCKGPHPFLGAKFSYLAASTFDTTTGQTLFPPYAVKTFEGISVAFIGLTLKGTPDIVSPPGVAGLQFGDEADTVNALIPELKAKGIEAIVVLIHEGGVPTGDYNECPGISGPIVDIVKKLDRAVDLVVSGHTHQAYICTIDGRLVTSGDKYGTIVTTIDVKLDRTTRDIISASATNHIVRLDAYAKDAEQTALIASYQQLAGPIANRKSGVITASLTREPTAAGESALGDVIADAQLAATASPEAGAAVIGMTNPGGIRTELLKHDDGSLTYAELFQSQPFRNELVTMTLSGAQLKQALEQQWTDPNRPRFLQISDGFSYTWDASRAVGDRIIADSLKLKGAPIAPDTLLRVTVNNFLASGGDGFKIFTEGTERRFGNFDIDALETYFLKNSPIAPPPRDRIQRLN